MSTEEIIRHLGHSYILATSARLVGRTLTLKDGDTFAVFDRYCDLQAVGPAEQGIFHQGTRMLSRYEFQLGPQRPLLLSSTVLERNAFITVDLTNPDIHYGDGRFLPRGIIHVYRRLFLADGGLFERTRIHNFSEAELDSDISFLFGADFADIFEVRGMVRPRRGEVTTAITGESEVAITYAGLDGVNRRTRIEFGDKPTEMTDSCARFLLKLRPAEPVDIYHRICFEEPAGTIRPAREHYTARAETLNERIQAAEQESCQIVTGNAQFNHWLNRSVADLRMLITQTPYGPYPYAGVPWFSTVFGRDGLITALQFLWVDPSVARGVLAYLAANQASAYNDSQDSEPGKILHEHRQGEMASLGEVPYGHYYGSIDSTPLFVMLAGEYWRRTGDTAFIETIWPNIERALEWMEQCGDLDGDGFLEYQRRHAHGLSNQGWKDSEDSVSHSDGSLAKGPIALCEVQAYAFAAKKAAALIAAALDRHELADRLRRDAAALHERFEAAFWDRELGNYVLALDGAKHPCRVQASNSGHALYAGIATPAHAQQTCRTLMSPQMFSGWGVRTLGESERRFNPMSYHNGSVWPHDNAIVAAGFARYGYTDAVHRMLSAMFDAALFVDLNRLPELFCGFPRRPGQGPTLYPVACIPQAWASGTVFLMLQACLGLSLRGDRSEISFHRPSLPEFLPEVELRNLRVGAASVDLLLRRHPRNVGITVLRRDGDVDIRVDI